MSNEERQKGWQECVAQWQLSGLSQKAFSIEHGLALRQVSYWIRRLSKSPTMPAMLPVRLASTSPVTATISLRPERGWTLNLPGDGPASWLAELMGEENDVLAMMPNTS